MCIYMYIHVYVCTLVYVYMYVCVLRQRCMYMYSEHTVRAHVYQLIVHVQS